MGRATFKGNESQRRNNLQICPRRDSNAGGSDLWFNVLPLDHGGAQIESGNLHLVFYARINISVYALRERFVWRRGTLYVYDLMTTVRMECSFVILCAKYTWTFEYFLLLRMAMNTFLLSLSRFGSISPPPRFIMSRKSSDPVSIPFIQLGNLSLFPINRSSASLASNWLKCLARRNPNRKTLSENMRNDAKISLDLSGYNFPHIPLICQKQFKTFPLFQTGNLAM